MSQRIPFIQGLEGSIKPQLLDVSVQGGRKELQFLFKGHQFPLSFHVSSAEPHE